MTFTALTYYLFVPIVFAIYWQMRSQQWRNLLILFASYFFYGWWDYRFCSLMLISSLVDYVLAIAIQKADRKSSKRICLALSMVVNLGMLGFFKYFNFFADSLGDMMLAFGFTPTFTTLNIVLPVGISFFTFQTMSYSIDVYRGRSEACYDLVGYMAYVSFFPQLVAGPIERPDRLLVQFTKTRRFDHVLAVDGCRLILWGLFKKVVIADNLAAFVNHVYYSGADKPGITLLLATIAFAFQIYCDFSGYSDIARGSARLFGFDLIRNFATPYFSQNINEFWRRWHISLSSWFRDYVYFPLGGSRVSRIRNCINLLLTFIVSGLWHGAAWHYVFWGAINGFAMLWQPIFGGRKSLKSDDSAGGHRNIPSIPTLLRMARTFAIILVTWIYFRASDVNVANAILGRIVKDMLSLQTYKLLYWDYLKYFEGDSVMSWLNGPVLRMDLMLWIVSLVVVEWFTRKHDHPLASTVSWPRPLRWSIYSLVIFLIFLRWPQTSPAFIYFQF